MTARAGRFGMALLAAGIASRAFALAAAPAGSADGEGMGASVIAADPADAGRPAEAAAGAQESRANVAGDGTGTGAAGTGRASVVADDGGVTGRLVVTVRPAVTIAGRWVKLGDVAELSGLSGSRLASLREARLQRTPMAGASKTLGVEELSRKLRALGVVEPFTVGGAETAVIEPSFRSLAGDELVKFGHDFLAGKVADAAGEGAEVRIEDPATPRALNVPEGELEFRAEAPARRLAGLVPITVEAWSDGERVARLMLSYRVRAQVQAVRAAKALEPGQMIGDADLETTTLDLAGVPEDALTTTASAVGLRVTRPVAAGAWLRRGAVAQPLKIRRGATVSVTARIGNVVAKASAQSKQDGAAGEIITVINPASKRTLRARVVDENLVEAVMP